MKCNNSWSAGIGWVSPRSRSHKQEQWTVAASCTGLTTPCSVGGIPFWLDQNKINGNGQKFSSWVKWKGYLNRGAAQACLAWAATSQEFWCVVLNGPHLLTVGMHKSMLKPCVQTFDTQIWDSSICSYLNLFVPCEQIWNFRRTFWINGASLILQQWS